MACVEHGGGDGERGRIEILDLLRPDVFLFQIERQFNHVRQSAARMTADKIFKYLLGFAGRPIGLLEPFDKLAVGLHPWFAHQAQDIGGNVFRRDFQAPAYMMTGQFLNVSPRILGQSEIEADPAGDEDVVDAGNGAGGGAHGAG